MKYLVYFVVGGHPNYALLLESCVKSIRAFPENDNIDILVMCNENYSQYIKHLSIKIHTRDTKDDAISIIWSRYDLFSVGTVYDYEKVLYLDSDITVTGSLHPLFEKVTRPNILYISPEYEGDNIGDFHKEVYYSRVDKPYTEEQLKYFNDNNIYVFNAGTYAFKPSLEIEQDFKEMYNTEYVHPNFTDQGYMNYHFNLKGNVSYDIKEFVRLVNWPGGVEDANVLINHFCNMQIPAMVKYERMEKFRLRT
jgi:lipopolysaccharide biosynthesis glycosyltransferase